MNKTNKESGTRRKSAANDQITRKWDHLINPTSGAQPFRHSPRSNPPGSITVIETTA